MSHPTSSFARSAACSAARPATCSAMSSVSSDSEVQSAQPIRMELVKSVKKLDGLYREVLYNDTVYVVFQYTKARVPMMMEMFVMELEQYRQLIRLHEPVNEQYLLRMTTNMNKYIVYCHQNGKNVQKSIPAVLFEGFSAIPRNGVPTDFREANCMKVSRNSKTRAIFHRRDCTEIAGHSIEPLSFPGYIELDSTSVSLNLSIETAKVYSATKYVKKVSFSASEDRKKTLRSAAAAMQKLAEKWRAHAAESPYGPLADEYLEFAKIAGLSIQTQPIGDPDEILDAAANVLLHEAKKKVISPEIVSNNETIKEMEESMEKLNLQEEVEEKKEIVELPWSSELERHLDMVCVPYNGQRFVVYRIRDSVCVVDENIFLDIHEVSRLSDVQKNCIGMGKHKYNYFKRKNGVNHTVSMITVHRFALKNYVSVGTSIVKSKTLLQHGESVDHINRVPEDNRLSNLRVATQTIQNFNQKSRKREHSEVLKRYFGVEMSPPSNVTLLANDLRNGSPLYKQLATENAFVEDFNVVIRWEVKVQGTRRKRGLVKKVNLVNIYKKQMKAAGHYAARLAKVPEERKSLAKDHQSLPILLLTQKIAPAEQAALHAAVRRGLVEELQKLIVDILQDEELCRETQLRSAAADSAVKYQEYIDICRLAGMPVEVDPLRLNAPRYCQELSDFTNYLDDLDRTLRGERCTM